MSSSRSKFEEELNLFHISSSFTSTPSSHRPTPQAEYFAEARHDYVAALAASASALSPGAATAAGAASVSSSASTGDAAGGQHDGSAAGAGGGGVGGGGRGLARLRLPGGQGGGGGGQGGGGGGGDMLSASFSGAQMGRQGQHGHPYPPPHPQQQQQQQQAGHHPLSASMSAAGTRQPRPPAYPPPPPLPVPPSSASSSASGSSAAAGGVAVGAEVHSPQPVEWRLRERMRTTCVGLALCLNIGVDPPDVVKPEPCARLEAWEDPQAYTSQKALEAIGSSLQEQYKRWQHRARYKQTLDPTVEDVKRLCLSLRRVAKDERVLFHYNGHGVPRPSANGEIWVFNQNYTQYIPLSLYDLQQWMRGPSIYVFDCNSAGLIVDSFNAFVAQRVAQESRRASSSSSSSTARALARARDNILLAACAADESLPVSPEFPADLFTSCLTTPIKVALRWFSSRSMLTKVQLEMIDSIPGNPTDRKSPKGELNWIFTAITDTIAWDVLPRGLFQKLFRQDLLVASLFRNFLLADRVMRSVGCTPVSHPRLPATHKHPMWQAWDLAAEVFLSQLEDHVHREVRFQHSSFFADQLTAFDVWLKFGQVDRTPPLQLPIVLQVLLSQVHRRRALILLARFMDKGTWAVGMALQVGFFHYVLKLLQSPAVELREVLVFIWTKILSYDPSCQADLVKEKRQQYFANHLAAQGCSDRQQIMSAFVLSAMARHHPQGQHAVLSSGVFPVFCTFMGKPDPLLRRWMCLCVAVLWERYEEAKWVGFKDGVLDKLNVLLSDPVPEVRTAAVYAIGTFMGGSKDPKRLSSELRAARKAAKLIVDGSPLVRREVVLTLGELLYSQLEFFVAIAKSKRSKGSKRSSSAAKAAAAESGSESGSGSASASASTGSRRSLRTRGSTSSIAAASPVMESMSEEEWIHQQRHMLWKVVLSCCRDPHPAVSEPAHALRKYMVSVRLPKSATAASKASSAVDGGADGLVLGASHGHGHGQVQARSGEGAHIVKPAPAPGLRKVQTMSAMSLMQEQQQQQQQQQVPQTHNKQQLPPRARRQEHPSRHKPSAGQGKESSKKDSSKASRLPWPKDPRELDPLWTVPRSTFYKRSALYFAEPLMGPSPRAEKSIETKLNEAWRARRNASMREHAKRFMTEPVGGSEDSGRGAFDQVAVFHSGFDQISTLLFHPYEDMLIAADCKDHIGLWNFEELDRINCFCNENARGTSITSAAIVNDLHVSALMTGCDDGVVRVWKDVHVAGQQRLASSWVAIRDLPRFSSRRARNVGASPSFVMDWQQSTGRLVASGATNVIRLWDVTSEMCVLDLDAASDAGVSTLCSTGSGAMVVAGYNDGGVRMFDTRVKNGFVAGVKKHRGRVVKVHLQRGGEMEGCLVSGGLKGDVNVGDLRMLEDEVVTIAAHQSRPLNAMAVHDYAPIVASGSHQQFIKVFDMPAGRTLAAIRWHEGFLGQRIGPVSALAFHPHRLLFAAGALDAFVSLHQAL